MVKFDVEGVAFRDSAVKIHCRGLLWHCACTVIANTNLMKEISGFYKLWSDRGEVHLRLFSMPVKPFRHCFVFLPDSIVKSMSANSFCDVSFQNLKQGVFIIYDLFLQNLI